MALTLKKLKEVMRFHLVNLTTSGHSVDNDTVLGDALSKQAVAGMSARALFKLLTRRDMIANDSEDVVWPDQWHGLTINTLAPQLIR
jgi:hypothetical protein